MDGASVLRTPVIATAVPAEWDLVKVQDVNRDGLGDLGWYDARILEFHYGGNQFRPSIVHAELSSA